MKKIIKYYYNIKINNIYKDGDAYYFFYNEKTFYFVIYERNEQDIKDIVEINKKLKSINIKCHDIIFNKFNNIFSDYNNNKYILLKVSLDFKKEVDIFEMINFNNKTKLMCSQKMNYRNSWKNLWQEKINYFETQIRYYAKEKREVLDTFSYYIGLAENAIEFINKTEKLSPKSNVYNLALCHRRVFSPNYRLNYFNPLSYVLDLEVRDYAEYFKSEFFCGQDINYEFISFLKTKKFDEYSYYMFYARLMFPTYYFDIYEKILRNEIVNEKLIEIVNLSEKYEKFLMFAHKEISKYSYLPEVSWLNK